MSIIYSAAGDTWSGISLRIFGSTDQAGKIRIFNPGIEEPIPAGTALTIPQTSKAAAANTAEKKRRPDLSASVPKLVIAGQEVRRFTDLTLSLHFDGIRTLEISAPFNPNNKETRGLWAPFKYQPVRLSVKGRTIFTGTAQNPAYSSGSTDRNVTLACYSTPGKMSECPPPLSAFPLAFKGRRLDFILKKIAGIYGIDVIFEADPGAAFDEVALEPGEAPLDWMADLTRARGLILTDNEVGDLVVTREAAKATARQDFHFGRPPVDSCEVTFNAGAAFSSVTAWRPETAREKGAKYTVKNPHLIGVNRPFTFRADSTEGGSIKAAAEAKAARMFPDMATWTVTVNSWDDQSGAVWEPGTFVSLYGPEVLVYNKTGMMIRDVTLRRQSGAESADLDLVLPGCFSGKIPVRVPWL